MKKLLIASLVAVLAACQTTNPDVIQRGDAQRLSQVQGVGQVTLSGSSLPAGS